MNHRLAICISLPPVAFVIAVAIHACGLARAAEPATRAAETSPSAQPAPVRVDKKSGLSDITFDTIKFEMVKGGEFKRSMLTKQIEDLTSKPIRIRGYIFPTFQQSGLTQFVLVRDNLECCFGPGAALYDCILVDMKEGRSTDYTTRPITVEGVFDVQEVLDPDGKHLAIYHLDGETVK